MAIWQFIIDFIPRENLIKRFGKIPDKVDDEIIDSENLTEGVVLPANYVDFLNVLGEKEELEWSKNSFNWGDYNYGTHITIDCEYIEEKNVFARFHVGEFDESFAKVVLEFAKMCNCLLLTNSRNIIEPEFNLFIEEMKNSNSYKFCKNPIEYLRSDEVKQINWSIRKKIAE